MKKLMILLLFFILMLAIIVSVAPTAVAGPNDPLPISTPIKEEEPADASEVEVVPISQFDGMAGQTAVLPKAPSLIYGQPLIRETEPNNNAGQANPITGGSAVILGNVYPNADEDYFSFTANAGDRVYAAIMTSFSANGSNDSFLEIIDPGGGVLEADNDDGSFGGLSSSIAGVTIPANGLYFVHVRHNLTTSQLRPYHLHFRLQSGLPAAELEPNNTTDTATPLPAAGWVAGSIGAVGDADLYSLSLNAGDTVFLSLDLDPERNAVTWNGRIGLGVFGGLILVANDASVTSPNSEAFFFTVKESGVYYVLVDSAVPGAGDASFTYHLSASVHPAAAPAGSCTTYTSNTAVSIPDAGQATSIITVPGNPRIADIDVSINLSHANMPDLDASLQAPGGNHVGLFTDVGSGNSIMNIILDDEAGIPVSSFTVLNEVQMQPELAYRLSWFDGQAAGGDWTLTLYDDLAANTGTLNSWSITICEPPPAPVCPNGATPTVLYNSDFEANDGGFTHSGAADEWERGLPIFAPLTSCHSGSSCWKTDLDNTYDFNSSQNLLSPVVPLTDPLLTGPVLVSWAQQYHLESASFDRVYVDVQQAGGGSSTRLWEWMDATMNNTVGPTPISIPESGGWGVHTRDISSYVGQNIELLFHLDSDSSVQLAGLAVDDVRVTGCLLTEPAVQLNKTVGTDPEVCANTDSITLPPGGGAATYCYEITNTGNVTLTNHTLTDDKLGTILVNFPYALSPGASAFLTQTAVITQTTLNTATWIATLPGASIPTSASDSDTALVIVPTYIYLPVIMKPD
jgi:subtilisin-like proprotein convertase family protein